MYQSASIAKNLHILCNTANTHADIPAPVHFTAVALMHRVALVFVKGGSPLQSPFVSEENNGARVGGIVTCWKNGVIRRRVSGASGSVFARRYRCRLSTRLKEQYALQPRPQLRWRELGARVYSRLRAESQSAYCMSWSGPSSPFQSCPHLEVRRASQSVGRQYKPRDGFCCFVRLPECNLRGWLVWVDSPCWFAFSLQAVPLF